MHEGAEYFECVGEPKNEDFSCSDSLTFELSKHDTYVSDHRHYFGHQVCLKFENLSHRPTKLSVLPQRDVQFELEVT